MFLYCTLIFPLFHACFFLCFIKDDQSESESEQNSGDEDLNEVERKQLQGVIGTVRHPEVNGITTEVCMFVYVTTASNHSLESLAIHFKLFFEITDNNTPLCPRVLY